MLTMHKGERSETLTLLNEKDYAATEVMFITSQRHQRKPTEILSQKESGYEKTLTIGAINDLNSLPEDTVSTFKLRLDKHKI